MGINETMRDDELTKFEKSVVSALQVGASFATVRASQAGATGGTLLGTPFGPGAQVTGGVIGATFAGAAAAEGGRMIINGTKTYFKNN